MLWELLVLFELLVELFVLVAVRELLGLLVELFVLVVVVVSVRELLGLLVELFVLVSVRELLGLLVELFVLVVVLVAVRELLGLLVELFVEVLVSVDVLVKVDVSVEVDVLELPLMDCVLVLPSASAAPDIITARKNAEVVARYFAYMAFSDLILGGRPPETKASIKSPAWRQFLDSC